MWWQHEFEGQKKAYEIADRAELEQVIRDSYASGYTDDLILQDPMLVLHFFNKISPPQLRKQTGLSRENLRNCTGF